MIEENDRKNFSMAASSAGSNRPYNSLSRIHLVEMDTSPCQVTRANSTSDINLLADNESLAHKMNRIELQVKQIPTSSKKYNSISCSNFYEENNRNEQADCLVSESYDYSAGFQHCSASPVETGLIQSKEKIIYNNNNETMFENKEPLHVNSVYNEKERVQSLCKDFKSYSSIAREVHYKPKLIETISIPISEQKNEGCSSHYLTYKKNATSSLDNALQSRVSINQRGHNHGNESLSLKKLQLAAKAEQLRIAEELVKQKEKEAEAKTREALQKQEAALNRKERILKLRKMAAEKKIVEAERLIEESKNVAEDSRNVEDCKRLKFNEALDATLTSLNNSSDSKVSVSCIPANKLNCSQQSERINKTKECCYSSEKQIPKFIQEHNHTNKLIRTVETGKVMPYDVLSNTLIRTGGRKAKKKILDLEICKIEPSLELSSLKHTYSRKSPKKRYQETKSPCSQFQPHLNYSIHFIDLPDKLSMQSVIDLPGSSGTAREHTLRSDSGTITITPLAKFDQPPRPFSAFPRLSSLDNTRKDSHHDVSSVFKRAESYPSRINTDHSSSSSPSDNSASLVDKVEKLTSDLQFQSLSIDREQEFQTYISDQETKPKVSDMMQSAFSSQLEGEIITKSEQVNCTGGYDHEDLKDSVYHVIPHSYTSHATSTPVTYITADTKADFPYKNANYPISNMYTTLDEDACRLGDIVFDPQCRSIMYNSQNRLISNLDKQENMKPLITTSKKLDTRNNTKEISNYKLDFEKYNIYTAQDSENKRVKSKRSFMAKHCTSQNKFLSESTNSYLSNDCNNSDTKILTISEEDTNSDSVNQNDVIKSAFVQSETSFKQSNEHRCLDYESPVSRSNSSPRSISNLIQIKYSTSDHSKSDSISLNMERVDTNLQTEYHEESDVKPGMILPSDTQNELDEALSSEELCNKSEVFLRLGDKKNSNIDSTGTQEMPMTENSSSSWGSDGDQMDPLDIGVGNDNSHNIDEVNSIISAENNNSAYQCSSPKIGIISPVAVVEISSTVNKLSQDYGSSCLIYTSPVQELSPVYATTLSKSFLTNCNQAHPGEVIYTDKQFESAVPQNSSDASKLESPIRQISQNNFPENMNENCHQIHPEELIFTGRHFESEVIQNSSALQEKSTGHISEDDFPDKIDEDSLSPRKEALSEGLSDSTRCVKNLEENIENLENSTAFLSDQNSFNLLSSTLIENDDEISGTNLSSCGISQMEECLNSKENNSVLNNNNNNNEKEKECMNNDHVTPQRENILKLREWLPDVTSNDEAFSQKDINDQSNSVCQISSVTNKCNIEIEKEIQPKRRGRKRGVPRTVKKNNDNSAQVDHKPRKKRGRKRKIVSVENEARLMYDQESKWMSNIIPAIMKEQNNFECGKCFLTLPSAQEFKSHAFKFHNGLARLQGDSQEFDEKSMWEILNLIIKIRKKVICEICKKLFKTLGGFKYHMERCGKTFEDLYTHCDICARKILITSLELHKKRHVNTLERRFECEKRKLSESNNIDGVGKKIRKAAQSCHRQMKLLCRNLGSSLDDSNDKDFDGDESDKYFYFSESPDDSPKFLEFNKNIINFGKSVCINEDCDVFLDDLAHLQVHMRSCSSSYVTCRQCYAIVKKMNTKKHLEDKHKDCLSNSSDEQSDEGEYEFATDSPRSWKMHVLSSKPYRDAIEKTKRFRKLNYANRLYPNLQCCSSDWIEIDNSLLCLYQSCQTHSPVFRLQAGKESNWERLENYSGKLLGSSSIFFTGGPIRSSAWCPIPESSDLQTQYIALACINNPDEEFPINRSKKHAGLIQIWNCGMLTKPETPDLCLGIAHEYGAVWSMDWCPSGIYERPSNDSQDNSKLNRLGLLAVAFSDGSIRIFLIPHPHQLVKKGKIFKKLPEFSLSYYNFDNSSELQCVKVCWCPSKSHSLIAGSFTNGIVCIWNLNSTSSLLSIEDDGGGKKLYPVTEISAHAGVCSAVSFCPKTEGRHIVTGGHDRTIKFWDLTEPEHPLTIIKKGIVTDSVWLPHWAGSFFAFDDAYSLGKTTTTFRENGFYGGNFRSVLGTNATVWSISGSDWLNAIIQADEAGEIVFSLQNTLNCEISGEKHMSKRRFPLFSARLKNFTDDPERDATPPNKKCFKEDVLDGRHQEIVIEDVESPSTQFIEQPLTYADSVEKFGIQFCDEDYKNLTSFNEFSLRSKYRSESMEAGPVTIYPLMGSSSVSWNNNFNSRTWVFVGLNSGLGRIIKIPFVD